jgi:hypothetical protein
MTISERRNGQSVEPLRTFGADPVGSQYVSLLLAWVRTHSGPSRWVDGNGEFGHPT